MSPLHRLLACGVGSVLLGLLPAAAGSEEEGLYVRRFPASITISHPRMKISSLLISRGEGPQRRAWRRYPLQEIPQQGPVYYVFPRPDRYLVEVISENGMSTQVDILVDGAPPRVSAQADWGPRCAGPLRLEGRTEDEASGTAHVQAVLRWSTTADGSWTSSESRTVIPTAGIWRVTFPAGAWPGDWTRMAVSVLAVDRAGNGEELVVAERTRPSANGAALERCP